MELFIFQMYASFVVTHTYFKKLITCLYFYFAYYVNLVVHLVEINSKINKKIFLILFEKNFYKYIITEDQTVDIWKPN